MLPIARWPALIAAPLLLTSCLLQPTKFVSTLDLRADRSFSFTYVGEVVLPRSEQGPAGTMPPPEGFEDQPEPAEGADAAALWKIAAPGAGARTDPPAPELAEDEDAAKFEQLARTLAGEYGYRSVRYLGHRKLAIDYRISGRLDHAFLFPFNPDGEVIIPFLAIELRGRDRVRVKAPGYANDQAAPGGMSGMGGAMGGPDSRSAELDGTFTLTTDAEIVSQNQEDGAASQPDGSKRIVWTATPALRDAPMAVLRVNALP